MTTYKKPTEEFPVSMDFSGTLPTGQTLQNTSDVKIYDEDGVDKTSTMLTSKSVASPKLNAIVKLGTSAKDYKITFIGITQNYRYEEDVNLKVRD